MPSRSSEPGELGPLLRSVLAAVARSGEAAPLVVIDGRSGAGKSTFARMLQQHLPGEVDLLPLDAFYPGWDGLTAASEMLADEVIAPRAAGEPGRWRRWDWDRGVAAEEHLVAPGRTLVVEGSGSLTPRVAAYATVSVWMDGPAPQRRARALARDGETYAPHWERWAAQEEQHVARNRPADLADVVYDPSTACTSASSR
ncbi:hypothetical protein [Microbacterium sp. SORGH_AS_0888]|uniref:hypothetical protein n=1 Tax=Microbacterium sp. SORGH_AS_0888 TaxID=3041791 RepID=UPI002782F522|nr:hypothetical protein [Microbacterium sp. SORGH_AS_0888]MDQ1128762.1 uridine kinase [Microbacterium sp. SORGH_AS_0888]